MTIPAIEIHPQTDPVSIALGALGALVFTVWFIGIAEIPRTIVILRRKPFNCQFCLPVWLTVTFSQFYIYLQVGIICGFTAAVLAPLIIKAIRNGGKENE